MAEANFIWIFAGLSALTRAAIQAQVREFAAAHARELEWQRQDGERLLSAACEEFWDFECVCSVWSVCVCACVRVRVCVYVCLCDKENILKMLFFGDNFGE